MLSLPFSRGIFVLTFGLIIWQLLVFLKWL